MGFWSALIIYTPHTNGPFDGIFMTAITLYGKMLAFSRLQIHTSDLADIQSSLANTLGADSALPVPIVLEAADELTVNDVFFDELIALLWQNNLAVIAVMDGVFAPFARTKKMAILPNDGKRIARISEQNKEQIAADKTTDETATAYVATHYSAHDKDDLSAKHEEHREPIRVYHQMLRSGQSIHHMGADLVITNVVNHGAEAVTDNNLHIYGKAQGRLVAGATGDENAHIFCQAFEPSLVSVAGTYCLKEDIPADVLGKAVQVSFDKESGLVFKVMQSGQNVK